MIKFLICSSLATISSQIAIAQQNLTIKAVDNTNQTPLQYVSISIDGQASFAGQSDKNGLIKLYRINTGKHQIQISSLGYKTWSRNVDVKDNLELTVALEPSTIQMEEVLVQSTRAKRNAPTTFKNISKEEITRN
ncbi:MAG TPA: hypothetical protein DHU90_12595, partial [Sphingobacterium sp.]|nr:hypothetical protein [Sphingobacterium sp.]